MLRYEFAPTNGGDESGFNDAVTTTFNTNLASTIARESLQNSIDAGVSHPVKVTFSMIPIRSENIPNHSELLKILEACKEYYAENRDSKTFFNHAINTIKENKICNILKISDFNTRGLTGSDTDLRGDYYNFLRSVGSSSKGSEKGGSFGLGKGSYFASSAFRTIFVSSKIHADSTHMFQGKLRLVSHKYNGEIKQGNGSFGLPGQKPIRDENLIPKLFKRQVFGTDINIVGFLNPDSWKTDIISSVLNNFWYAIDKGTLEVKVDDIDITAGTLESLMHKYFDEQGVAIDSKENPFPFYEAFKHPTKIFEEDLPTLGKVKLYILTKENLPKRVACFRKTGMLIEAKRFLCIESYAGVFICDNEIGNGVLRKMEPPTHNEWTKDSPNAKVDGKTLPEVVTADKELKIFIKSSLKNIVPADRSAALSVQGLTEYLYLPQEDGVEPTSIGEGGKVYGENSIPKETGIEIGKNTKETIIPQSPESFKPIKTKSTGSTKEGPDIGDGGVGDGRGGNGAGHGGSATADSGKDSIKVLSDLKFRSFYYIDSSEDIWHMLILRGKPHTKCSVNVEAGTDDSYDKVPIMNVKSSSGNTLSVTGNVVKDIELDKKGEAHISVQFDGKDRYSLKVVAYENQ